MTPGYKTTEFWVTLVVVLGLIAVALISVSQGNDVPEWAVAAIGVVVAVYIGQRGSLKKNGDKNGTKRE